MGLKHKIKMAKGEFRRSAEVVSREYTIHLHKHVHGRSFKKCAPHAVRAIRQFAEKAMGTKDVRLDVELNKQIWSKGVLTSPSACALFWPARSTMTRTPRRSSTRWCSTCPWLRSRACRRSRMRRSNFLTQYT